MKPSLPFHLGAMALLLALAAARCPADDAAPRLAVPDAATVQDNLKQVKEVYQNDLAQAKHANEKSDLARRMLQAGIGEADTAAKYALLTEAQSTALDGGDSATAFRIIDELDKTFQIDALARKADIISAQSKISHTNEEARTLVTLFDTVIDQALAAERYDLASQICTASMAVAHLATDPAIQRLAAARQQQIKELDTAYQEVKAALPELHDKPTDPDANLKVGRFRCLYKGDWATGLPMLILGSDPALRELAEREFEGPSDLDATLALADSWWTLAEKETLSAKTGIHRHAAGWYRQALPKLSGLSKARVEKRLALLAEEEPAVVHLVSKSLLDTQAHFDARWRQTKDSGNSSSYKPQEKAVRVTGHGDLGGISTSDPWTSVTFDLRCDHSPGELGLKINGTPLAFQGLTDAAKSQYLQVTIRHDTIRKTAALAIATRILDQKPVTQEGFGKKLDLAFDWPAQRNANLRTVNLDIRNVSVSFESKADAAAP